MNILLKLLLPSWGFFKSFDDFPKVYLSTDQSNLKEWSEVFCPKGRKWWHLFFSPKENRRLAILSNLLLFIDRANAHSKEALTSKPYIRLLRACSAEALEHNPEASKIQIKFSQLNQGEWEDVFTSPNEEIKR